MIQYIFLAGMPTIYFSALMWFPNMAGMLRLVRYNQTHFLYIWKHLENQYEDFQES